MTHTIFNCEFAKEKNHEEWIEKEWLIANGLGGYSSSTLACVPTRMYHGVLVASLPVYGRTVLLNHLLETVRLDTGQEIILNNLERSEAVFDLQGVNYLESFCLENGLPVWTYNFEGLRFQKKLVMTHVQSTTHILYECLSEGRSIEIKLYPYCNFHPISQELVNKMDEPYLFTIAENRYEIFRANYPPLRLYLSGECHFVLESHKVNSVFYRREARRGYPPMGTLWSPGYFILPIRGKNTSGISFSIENWDQILALQPKEAIEAEFLRKELLLSKATQLSKSHLCNQLIFSADAFIIKPSSRTQDNVRAHAAGDEVRTVIAGYHWFADWGRDTMISLEGLTLCTGREDEARWILRTFAYYVKQGLIPNMFPEGYQQGLYHTADATLWFFHALNRYFEKTNDRETLHFIFPKLLEIYHAHIHGTAYNIRVDHNDGLLMQGAEGYQLTWMDAKVEDWVVTPRRGKAVEINALWYNALKIFEKWLELESYPALQQEVKHQAAKVYESFNQKFWNEKNKYLFDVIEGEKGNDESLRPNQLFALSLDYPVLDPARWKDVFISTKDNLLTPVGLRSLAAGDPDFKASYTGDLRARDAAYHQGTVWTWLIGPYIDAWLRVFPDEKNEMRKYIEEFQTHLTEAGIGFISEIFDALPPHHARGCIAQAWSVAELLRCITKVF